MGPLGGKKNPKSWDCVFIQLLRLATVACGALVARREMSVLARDPRQ